MRKKKTGIHLPCVNPPDFRGLLMLQAAAERLGQGDSQTFCSNTLVFDRLLAAQGPAYLKYYQTLGFLWGAVHESPCFQSSTNRLTDPNSPFKQAWLAGFHAGRAAHLSMKRQFVA